MCFNVYPPAYEKLRAVLEQGLGLQNRQPRFHKPLADTFKSLWIFNEQSRLFLHTLQHLFLRHLNHLQRSMHFLQMHSVFL